MLIKAALLFLLAMLVIGWIGKALMGRRPTLRLGRRAATCPACGRPAVGRGPCPCGKA